MFLWDASSLADKAEELETSGHLSSIAARLLLSATDGRVVEIIAGMLANAALHPTVTPKILACRQLPESILIAIASVDDAAALSELFRLVGNLLRYCSDLGMRSRLGEAGEGDATAAADSTVSLCANPILAGFFSTAFLRGRLVPVISNTLSPTLLERFLEALTHSLRCSVIVGGPVTADSDSDPDGGLVLFPFNILTSGLGDLLIQLLDLFCAQSMLAAVRGGAGASWEDPPEDAAGPSTEARAAEVSVSPRAADLLLRCIEGIALVLNGEPFLPSGAEDLQARFVFEGARLCHRAHALCGAEAVGALLGETAGEIAASAAVARSTLLDVFGENEGGSGDGGGDGDS